MLTARRIPQTCQACRSQLQTLFEHGFTAPNTLRIQAPRTRFSTRPRYALGAANARRGFAVSARRSEAETTSIGDVAGVSGRQSGTMTNVPTTPTAAEIEATVRSARHTFGETLPKDFLSTEEMVIYERFYGKPLRETTVEDLEIRFEEAVEDGQASNVLLRQREDGEWEEVEMGLEYEGEGLENVEGEILNATARDVEFEINEVVVDAEVNNDIDPEAAPEISAEESEENMTVTANSQREMDAILRLQRDMEAAMANVSLAAEEEMVEQEEEEEYVEEEEVDEDEYDEEEPDAYISSDSVRTHPHTMIGRWGTTPGTLELPKLSFVKPVTELLERPNHKHLKEAAEKAFGGAGLPYSSSTPASKKSLKQKHIGLEAGQFRMSEIEADAYMAAVLPGVYSSVMSTLVEIRKRLGSSWLRDLLLNGQGPRVLDAGAGGAGALAWRQILQTEWDLLAEEGIVSQGPVPYGKTTVLIGPDTLRFRMSQLLDNTTFIPRLPDYIHTASEDNLDRAPAKNRKTFDIVVAPHTLLPLSEDFRRRNMVENLWELVDPQGGILILLEKGLPRGFEAVAEARSQLLEKHIINPDAEPANVINPSNVEGEAAEETKKEPGMIIAPCTNHTGCPMYTIPGISSGRKDFCHFSQRFTRPPFLQKILGATTRNHEDVKFSYLAVRRGIDLRSPTSISTKPLVQGVAATDSAFAGHEELISDLEHKNTTPEYIFMGEEDGYPRVANPDFNTDALALPRAVLKPLKRHGHVTFDFCTPAGTLERWTVPKSFSAQAYRDARKAKWGDLWALGAKTRVERVPRLGKAVGKLGRLAEAGKMSKRTKEKLGIKGRDLAAVERSKKKGQDVFELLVGDQGMENVRELGGKRVYKGDGGERRTKGGRAERGTKIPKEYRKEAGRKGDEDYLGEDY
jgi:ribosomal protein RSM22 (predicted rRNA methylase)